MNLQSTLNPRLHLSHGATAGSFAPTKMRTQLRLQYAGTAIMDGKVSNFVMSGNNVFDPGYTFSSSKPPGFAYWALLYDRYRCYGSKCQVVVQADTKTANTSGSLFQVEVVMAPTPKPPSWANTTVAGAQPGAKTKMFDIIQRAELSSVMSTAKQLGVRDMVGTDRVQAAVSAGPTSEWFWGVSISSTADMSSLNVARYTVTVTYDVEFFERAANLAPTVEQALEKTFAERLRILAAEEKEATEARLRRNIVGESKRSVTPEEEPDYIVPPTLRSAAGTLLRLSNATGVTPRTASVTTTR